MKSPSWKCHDFFINLFQQIVSQIPPRSQLKSQSNNHSPEYFYSSFIISFKLLIALYPFFPPNKALEITMICCQIVSLQANSRTWKPLQAGGIIKFIDFTVSTVFLVLPLCNTHFSFKAYFLLHNKSERKSFLYVKNCSPTEVGKIN